MREVNFRKGETIFFEGDIGDDCYKIISGSVEIRMSIPGVLKRNQTETIATCGAGEIIGEMSLIDKGPRSASAVAIEPTYFDLRREELDVGEIVSLVADVGANCIRLGAYSHDGRAYYPSKIAPEAPT